MYIDHACCRKSTLCKNLNKWMTKLATCVSWLVPEIEPIFLGPCQSSIVTIPHKFKLIWIKCHIIYRGAFYRPYHMLNKCRLISPTRYGVRNRHWRLPTSPVAETSADLRDTRTSITPTWSLHAIGSEVRKNRRRNMYWAQKQIYTWSIYSYIL